MGYEEEILSWEGGEPGTGYPEQLGLLQTWNNLHPKARLEQPGIMRSALSTEWIENNFFFFFRSLPNPNHPCG